MKFDVTDGEMDFIRGLAPIYMARDPGLSLPQAIIRATEDVIFRARVIDAAAPVAEGANGNMNKIHLDDSDGPGVTELFRTLAGVWQLQYINRQPPG